MRKNGVIFPFRSLQRARDSYFSIVRDQRRTGQGVGVEPQDPGPGRPIRAAEPKGDLVEGPRRYDGSRQRRVPAPMCTRLKIWRI